MKGNSATEMKAHYRRARNNNNNHEKKKGESNPFVSPCQQNNNIILTAKIICSFEGAL